MGDKTGIAWTDATWNPVRGCSVVSPGCTNCYAMKQAARFDYEGGPYDGLTLAAGCQCKKAGQFDERGECSECGRTFGRRHPVWSGKIKLVEEKLEQPLRWTKPRRIFVNSMSDLFHEGVPDAYIDRVFAIMAIARHHTFQVLTKRPERMRAYASSSDTAERVACELPTFGKVNGLTVPRPTHVPAHLRPRWPLGNVWLGVSAEDQKRADERIPLLLQTPAAVRFVSAEPLLGPLDLARWLRGAKTMHLRGDVEGMLRNRLFDSLQHDDGRGMSRREAEDALFALHAKGVKFIPFGDCDAFTADDGCPGHPRPGLDWIIAGGESGPGARSCNVSWLRSIVEQCKAAKVACFVKQLGSKPYDSDSRAGVWTFDEMLPFKQRDRKGADPSEWPRALRVQEFPR